MELKGMIAAEPCRNLTDSQSYVCVQLHSAPALSALATKLSQELAAELKAQLALQRLQGMLEPVIAASVGRTAPSHA